MATKRVYGVLPFKSPRLPGETRVYTTGDSIAAGLRDALHPRLQARGYVTSQRCAPGEGVLDWGGHFVRDHVIDDVNAFDPDVVVCLWRGNYKSLGNGGVPGIDIDTPEFYAAWTAELVAIGNHVIQQKKAQVFFVLGPSMLDETHDRITRTIATNTRAMVRAQMGKAGCLEAYNVCPDPWAEDNCEEVAVRTPEGLHFTAAGYELLADYVERALVPVS